MTPATRSIRSDINITPLIDIVLVLLIVFIIMVPTLSKVLETAIPQVGPDVKGQQPKDQLVVTLKADGQLLLQQTQVDRTQLVAELVPALLKQPIQYRKVFLKVDGEQSHGAAVAVMDLLRQADARVQKESRHTFGLEGPEARIVLGQAKAEER